MHAANGSIEHPFHNVISLLHGVLFTVNDQAMAVDPQRNRERVFQSREILIEFSEQPELIGEFA